MTATYNKDALEKIKPELHQFATMDLANFDSVNTPFIGRLLKVMDPVVFEVLKPDTSFAKLMAVNTGKVPTGANEYTYGVTDRLGAGRVINPNSPTRDLPQGQVILHEKTHKVEHFGNSYVYTIQELQNAAQQAIMGVSFQLDAERRVATLKAHEYRWNNVALFGSTEADTKGLLTNTDIPSDAVASTGTGSATGWDTKTGINIIADITNRYNKVRNDSKGVHTPNTIAMTPEAMGLLRSTHFDSAKSTFAYLRETFPELTPIEVPELAGAFSAADGFIVYEKSDRNIEFLVAKPFTESQPVYGGLAYQVECDSRYVAAPVIRYPKAFAIGTGV